MAHTRLHLGPSATTHPQLKTVTIALKVGGAQPLLKAHFDC